VVDSPGLQTAILPDAFTVEPATPYEITVRILGPNQARADRARGFNVVLHNSANDDAAGVPLWISGIPPGGTLSFTFDVSAPLQEGGEPDWSTVPVVRSDVGGSYAVLVIPRLKPGTTVRRVYVTVPNSVTSYELTASLTPPWLDSEALRACLTGGAVITDAGCMGTQLTALDAYMVATGGIDALNGLAIWAKEAWNCEGAGTIGAAQTAAEAVLDFMLQPVAGTAVPADCEVALVPRWQDRKLVTIVSSLDPNEKFGPGGSGPSRTIAKDEPVAYTIQFENVEAATAPAQEVVVGDLLDDATLDYSTLNLGIITFGDRVLYPPPGLKNYATDIDLRPGTDLLVRLDVSLNEATGALTWTLNSLDPVTGLPPEDPLSGFLPPNLAPPQGEGSVLLTLMPDPGLPGGTEISNGATVIFDAVPLETADWVNTLDVTVPQSQVLPLPANVGTTTFTVEWEAVGAPADLHDFSVYVADDGGEYRVWRAHTTANSDTFSAAPGHQYAFYSLARDSSGNMETPPEVPDAVTTTPATVSVGDAPRLQLALVGAVPNPAFGQARVRFVLPSAEPAIFEVIDVQGRRLLRRDVGSLGPGRHDVEVSRAITRPGLYFLRLAQGGQVLRSKMVMMR